MTHHQILIIGGGTAGLTIAAMLRNQPDAPQVTIIEPNEKHYYQPIWTLVGGGVFSKDISERNEADFIPDGASWIKDKVVSLNPDNNSVELAGGDTVTYDYLVVAAGIQIDWDKIPGLKESVGKPGTGVCSNSSILRKLSKDVSSRKRKSGMYFICRSAPDTRPRMNFALAASALMTG